MPFSLFSSHESEMMETEQQRQTEKKGNKRYINGDLTECYLIWYVKDKKSGKKKFVCVLNFLVCYRLS